jgi:hypothetical protein
MTCPYCGAPLQLSGSLFGAAWTCPDGCTEALKSDNTPPPPRAASTGPGSRSAAPRPASERTGPVKPPKPRGEAG